MNSYKNKTIPSKWYYDKGIYKKELKNIFNNTWHLAGHINRLINPGDVIVAQVLKEPIIIIRQEDGSIKSFYNVCQHRAGPLLYKDQCIKKIQCKYHGWIYDNDGTLENARGFSGDKNFNKDSYSLKSIKTSIWMGLIFINFSENSKSISSYLKEIKNRISPISFEYLKFSKRVSYYINCNWKVYIDNYLEGLHIPIVHPKLNKTINYKSYKTELFKNCSLQYAPLLNISNPYSRLSSQDSTVYYYTIFPNILLNIGPSRLQTNVVEPINKKSCVVHFDYYFEKENNNNNEEDYELSELIQQEDIKICEQVQSGLKSNGYNIGQFSIDHETGVAHFQKILKSYLK